MGFRDAIREAAVESGLAEPKPPPAGVGQWDYKVVVVHQSAQKGAFGGGSMEESLKKRGMEGWELVGVFADRMIFKRPLPPGSV